MIKIINISWPINAGKSTVSKELNKRLSNSLFVEVDDLLGDEEQKSLNLDFWGGIYERLNRLDALLEKNILENKYDALIFAYPVGEGNYNRWRELIPDDIPFYVITLSPKLEICQTNRGSRKLSDWEIKRIAEMYEIGHANPKHSDLIIDNSNQTVDETVTQILEFLDA